MTKRLTEQTPQEWFDAYEGQKLLAYDPQRGEFVCVLVHEVGCRARRIAGSAVTPNAAIVAARLRLPKVTR